MLPFHYVTKNVADVFQIITHFDLHGIK